MTRTAAPRRRPREAHRKHRPVHPARVPSPRRPRPRQARRSDRRHRALASYRDGVGLREVVLLGAGGSALVVDRDAATRCDARLVAHLDADEPPENAARLSRMYIRDTPSARCDAERCRPADPAGSHCTAPPCAVDRALVHRALEGAQPRHAGATR